MLKVEGQQLKGLGPAMASFFHAKKGVASARCEKKAAAPELSYHADGFQGANGPLPASRSFGGLALHNAGGYAAPSTNPIPVRRHNPTQKAISVGQIQQLQRQVGRTLTIRELAMAFPEARIGAKGATLSEIAQYPVNKVAADGAPLVLGAASIDKNGDIDASRLYQTELIENNQNLIIKRGDELPVPLSHTIKNSVFVIRDKQQLQELLGRGFPASQGSLRIDLKDMTQVHNALDALGFDPTSTRQREAALAKQGVHVSLSTDDQLRRILLGKLDSAQNELDIDEALIDDPGGHNDEIQPTVYASAKLNPAHLDEVILTYKRFNNQSYAGQGSWTTELLNKDEASQHEFDSEAVFVKLDSQTHEVETVLAARHYFGELYDKDDLNALQERTGRDDLTTSVSYLAHGSRLAENTERNVWAGHGKDGVKAYDPRDHVFKDEFMGLEDARRGDAIFIPKERVQLVLESDDRQTLNLQTQFGATRKGILGTRVMDLFNDGDKVDRFGGTGWYYEQERYHHQGNIVDRGFQKVVDTAKDGLSFVHDKLDMDGDGQIDWADAKDLLDDAEDVLHDAVDTGLDAGKRAIHVGAKAGKRAVNFGINTAKKADAALDKGVDFAERKVKHLMRRIHLR